MTPAAMDENKGTETQHVALGTSKEPWSQVLEREMLPHVLYVLSSGKPSLTLAFSPSIIPVALFTS